MMANKNLVAVSMCLVIVALTLVKANQQANKESLIRKSIVFDLKTPKVFYCPQEKPSNLDKMIVKAKPLENLCQYGGSKMKPKDAPSDCYNDVDETDFACDEKRRFMIKLDLATDAVSTGGLDDLDYIMTKEINKKAINKKY